MLKIAVTGVYKKHIGNIASVLIQRGAIPLDMDVTQYRDVRRAIMKASPDIIVHTASKSKPNWCEEHTTEAADVNLNGSLNVAYNARDFHIPVVALSTDHVFTGRFKVERLYGFVFDIVRGGPYSERYLKTLPVNYYGMTKLAMEAAMEVFDNVKVVRTSNCFWEADPRAMWYIDQLYKQDKVPVPTFQLRSFMHREHFVDSLEKYCENFRKMPKVLHISGSETITWYQFMQEFGDALGISETLRKKFTKKRKYEQMGAERPKRAGLKVDLSRRLGLPQYSYRDGLEIL